MANTNETKNTATANNDVLELLKPEEVEETPGETEETVEETVEEAEETAETPKRGRRRKEDTE